MGLLEDVMGALGGKGGSASALMAAAAGLLGSGGGAEGLTGLLSRLTDGGQGDQVKSWVGKGPNQQISGNQLKQAMNPENLEKIAQEAGVSEQEAANGMAAILPDVVNQLTPDGKVPDKGQLDDMIGSLVKQFGK
jgi:uncharacterized protein YidB (DUF937 family)